GILPRRQIIRIRSRICRIEPVSRQMCSDLSEICRIEPTLRQMCSVLTGICRIEPTSRQMCSNLNGICRIDSLCSRVHSFFYLSHFKHNRYLQTRVNRLSSLLDIFQSNIKVSNMLKASI